MADSIPAPFDVKLMNIVATLLFALCGLMLLAASAWWVLRQPFFPLAGIKVDGELTHNNVVTLARRVTALLCVTSPSTLMPASGKKGWRSTHQAPAASSTSAKPT